MKRTCLQKNTNTDEHTDAHRDCEFHPEEISLKEQHLDPKENLQVESFVRMKKVYVFLVITLIAMHSFGQTKKELRLAKNKADYAQIKNVVESKDFTFEADYVNPQLGGTRNLTAPNTLRIHNDSVYCDLPFFGTAYNIMPGVRGGFHFEEPLNNWLIDEHKRKMQMTLTFEARTPGDWYKCTFYISGSENASLVISSQNRSTISFWGKLLKTEKGKEE